MSKIILLNNKFLPILIGFVLSILMVFFVKPLPTISPNLNIEAYNNPNERSIIQYWSSLGPSDKKFTYKISTDQLFISDTAYVITRSEGLSYLFPSNESDDPFIHQKLSIQRHLISINHLKPGDYRNFMQSVEKEAGKTGFDTLVLDLTKFSSGSLNETIKVGNQLIFDKGILLTTIRYFDNTQNEIKSTGDVFFPVKHIEVKLGPSSCNLAYLLAQMLKKGAKAMVNGGNKNHESTVFGMYPLGKENFVAIPVGKF